jgi:hypothetical protein
MENYFNPEDNICTMSTYKERSNKIELNINRWQEYQNLIKEEITLNDISKEIFN